MRLPVFGKPKYSREEMERVAAQELEAAIQAAPRPPDPSLASWTAAPVAPVAAAGPAPAWPPASVAAEPEPTPEAATALLN